MSERPARGSRPSLRDSRVRRHLIILTLLVVALRLPFANQAVGGDDVYYLAAAYHALIDPLHPNHTHYIFEGADVTFQGYPHPPGNAAFLALLTGIFKDVREVPFHLAYVVFSLTAVYAMYALACRFCENPMWATLLFIAVPAFVINGNTFESDLPFLAFWSAGAACFVYAVDRTSTRLLAFAALCLAVAGMIAMQSFLFTPILLAYIWTRLEKPGMRYIAVAFTPILILIAWQIFERLSSGQFPAAVSAGYMARDGFATVAVKLRNALALTIHAAFMIFPILLPFTFRAVWRRWEEADTGFLVLWAAIFLGGAWVVFYAGSARYLLPIAVPLAILASRAPLRWVQAAVVLQLAISVCLATVNYQQWNAYRSFANNLVAQAQQRRIWVDAEWGLRHYLEADGAQPMLRDQWIPTGDLVVESDLAFPAPIPHGGRALVPIAETDIDPALVFRLIGLDSASGYSTTSKGLLPYDVRGGVIDRVHAYVLRAQDPQLADLSMGAKEADSQIVSGIFPSEGAPWRWMSDQATVLLKSPQRPATLEIKLYIADAAPARRMDVSIEGGPSASRTFPGPGTYTFTMGVDVSRLSPVVVKLQVDRAFQASGDQRKLGVILNEIALR